MENQTIQEIWRKEPKRPLINNNYEFYAEITAKDKISLSLRKIFKSCYTANLKEEFEEHALLHDAISFLIYKLLYSEKVTSLKEELI